MRIFKDTICAGEVQLGGCSLVSPCPDYTKKLVSLSNKFNSFITWPGALPSEGDEGFRGSQSCCNYKTE